MTRSWDNAYLLPLLRFGEAMLLFLREKTDSHGRSFRTAPGDPAASMTQLGRAAALATAISLPDTPLSGQRSSVISRAHTLTNTSLWGLYSRELWFLKVFCGKTFSIILPWVCSLPSLNFGVLINAHRPRAVPQRSNLLNFPKVVQWLEHRV